MNDRKTSPQAGSRACGCKGIRSCSLCVTTDFKEVSIAPRRAFNYCIYCKKAWHIDSTSVQQKCSPWHGTSTSQSHKNPAAIENTGNYDNQSYIPNNDTSSENKTPVNSYPRESKQNDTSSEDKTPVNSSPRESKQLNSSEHLEAGPRLDVVGSSKLDVVGSPMLDVVSRDVRSQSRCSHNTSQVIDFKGIVIIEEFVSQQEEADLDSVIAATHFVNSQSGRRKQDFGPKVNFKKQKVRTANFTGLPSYSQFLYQRMKAHPHLSDFEPVELCNLEYCQHRGAHIDAHLDDDWLWGERLVTLNLLSDSVLTFTLDSEPDVAVRVPLLRRSLIVVSAAARYSWKHSILPEDVRDRRIAMTFRELSKEFSGGGCRGCEGAELLKLALTFSGSAVGS